MKPWLHKTAEEFAGRVKFVSVDVDKSKDVASKFKVEFMPTIVMMKGEEEVDRVVGASKDEILAMIHGAL